MMPHSANERFKLLTIGGLAELPDPDWLIEGVVPVRGFVNLYGPPKKGKSFIALDWGLSISMGVPWLGHQVKTGPVVYIYSETPSDLKARVPAWCMARSVSPLEFLMLPSRVNITDPSERARLIKLIEESSITPVLLVIDTLAKCSGGIDEQSNKEMGRFVDACESLRDHFDCAVMVVHHAGKDLSAGSRGASALTGAVDAQFQVTRLGKAKGEKIRLVNECQRSASEHPEMWLALIPSQNAMVLQKTTAPGREAGTGPKPPSARQKVIDALEQRMPNGATDAEWKQAAMDKRVAERTFGRRKKDLIEEGIAKKKQGRWFLVPEADRPNDDVLSFVCNPTPETVH